MNSQLLQDGIAIAITGYLIVFAALTLIFVAFYFTPKILKIRVRKILQKQNSDKLHRLDEEISGATIAAISSALYMYFNEKHDEESYQLTIKKISRTYSPWSSKIYGMNNTNKM